MKYFFAFSLFSALAVSGCGALVDSVPSSPEPVLHVADYYLPLKDIGASYSYCRKSPSGADTINMTMDGNDAVGAMLGIKQCYATALSKTDLFLNSYYFRMNDSEAYTLGRVSCNG